ncbi:glycosyltransferase [Sulfurovum sp. XGS-02]|uniref:glycosyltransferase n=1 Tax=Sulfurovum sp. XGS-02 TaxID=2925411 RepID=UPI00205C638B|nr:glycosyltransferase [Sulfurovum sp. XGS-02]UPT76866.1 glycosyltransferase [Sulfurovum sp. XGS-02]
MKLIINTSNLYVGGGLQVAISFINELRLLDVDYDFHIFLSKAANKQIDQKSFPSNFNFYLIEKSPSSLAHRKEIIKQLDKLEESIQPNVVFSIFGPTFWTPKTVHVMGFALPWLINPDSSAFGQLSFLKRVKKRIENLYKAYFIKKNADFYVTETEDTKFRLSKFHKINEDKIFVVGNTYSSYFNEPINQNTSLPERQISEFRLVTISHNYPHKNLKIIKEIILYLKEQPIQYKFILTIDQESYESLFSDVQDYVITLKPINTDLCPSVYDQCDALFLPTLLECFTASYPEAMKMKKPILTSDLSFAKDICKDSALYFDPLDAKNIADKIIELSTNKQLQNDLIVKGAERLSEMETAESRAKKYLKICENIALT